MDKIYIYIGISVGGLIGSYVPSLIFHANALSTVSMIGGIVGSIAGLYAGYKISQNMD